MKRIDSRCPSVVIVGAGMSGICLAIRLKEAGFEKITILEKSDDVGGTWLENSYPNAGCDVPSFLYCYSFAPNYQWSMKYARQPEILAYFKSCVDRFEIRPHIRFQSSVVSATFDESTGTWGITTSDGDLITSDVFISAVGQLNRPHVPPLDGLENFGGMTWHSARWNHDFDLAGKVVAVIGNGASAIQFIPQIAEKAKKTYLVQRTPCWIHPLHNYRYANWTKWVFRNVPLVASVHRLWIYLMCEWRILAFQEGSWLSREYARWLRRQMRRLIPEEQWSQLIPEYAPGCKRILLSSDYLQTLGRDDVELITDPLVRFEPDGVVTESRELKLDAAIFATGFKATEILQPLDVRGRDGKSIEDVWEGRPKAYFGMATPGFPNMFMLYGPNTNLGHNSIIFMVKHQVNYVVRCLMRMRKEEMRFIEVDQHAMDDYDKNVQQRLQSTVWAGDCSSWYKSNDGAIVNNWWGSATSYWLRALRPRFAAFRLRP